MHQEKSDHLTTRRMCCAVTFYSRCIYNGSTEQQNWAVVNIRLNRAIFAVSHIVTFATWSKLVDDHVDGVIVLQ